jgi:hypothetical protein
MAHAADINAVAAYMPGVPRHVIESRINSGAINPENYYETEDE